MMLRCCWKVHGLTHFQKSCWTSDFFFLRFFLSFTYFFKDRFESIWIQINVTKHNHQQNKWRFTFISIKAWTYLYLKTQCLLCLYEKAVTDKISTPNWLFSTTVSPLSTNSSSIGKNWWFCVIFIDFFLIIYTLVDLVLECNSFPYMRRCWKILSQTHFLKSD